MKTAEKFVTIGDGEYYYTSGYYTDNRWIDNDTLILARFKRGEADDREVSPEYYSEIVKYSFTDGRIEVITNDCFGDTNYVVRNNIVYFIDKSGTRIMAYDTKTEETRLVYEKDFDDVEILQMPSITNDGKTICIYNSDEEKGGFFAAIDVETGKRRWTFQKKFNVPFTVANHGMICPENPDRMFFAHEGITFYISNRLWIYDNNLKKAWNLAEQKLNADGDLGDCYGHEMWAPDGKGMYFVKYPCSPEGPRGICYVDIETKKTEILYSGYDYWHTGVSQDGKFITADTNRAENPQVVVIDLADGTESVIDIVDTTWNHPCHPHPQLSPDNSKLVYTILDDKGRISVKVAYLK